MVRPSIDTYLEPLKTAESSDGTAGGGDDVDWPTAPSDGTVIVEELDGDPSVSVRTIIFDGATVTDNGDGTATVTSAGESDAVDVHAVSGESGAGSENVQGQLDELYGAVGWAVDSVGSLTASGSPQTVINDSAHNFGPGLIRLDPGRVLTVYMGDGTDHFSDHELCGQIGLLNAARDGVTSWGSRFVIHADADDIRCEDAVSIVDGRIVAAFRLYDGSANHTPSMIVCDDAPQDFTEASTWGSPITFPAFGGSVQNYTNGYVRRLASGDYLMPAGKQSAGTHTVGLWKWDGGDGLDDPSGGAFITVASGANDYAEIAVEALNRTGDQLALVRSVAAGSTYKVFSTDHGATWGSPASAHDGYGYPMFRKLLSGLILTVYRDAPDGDTMWRVSTNDAASFGSETLLDATGTRSGYATLLQVSPHDVMCAYGTEGAGSPAADCDILLQRFTDTSTFTAHVTQALALDDLTDVNAPTPGDGDFLSWDDGAGEWVNVGAPGGSVPDGTDPGDILAWDGDSWAVLPISTNDYVLTADDGEALGVKWAEATGGAATNLAKGRIDRNSVGGNITHNSTTWVDMDSTNLTITMTTGARSVILICSGRFSVGASALVRFNFSVDGTPVASESAGSAGIVSYREDANGNSHGFMMYFLTDTLSAASHTFRPRWNVSTNTVTAYQSATDDHIIFQAVEVYA